MSYCGFCRSTHEGGCSERERVLAAVKKFSEEENNGVLLSRREYNRVRSEFNGPDAKWIIAEVSWSGLATKLGLTLSALGDGSTDDHLRISARVLAEVSQRIHPAGGVACNPTEYDRHRPRKGELSSYTIKKTLTWLQFVQTYTDLELLGDRFYRRENRLREEYGHGAFVELTDPNVPSRKEYVQAMAEKYSDGMAAKIVSVEEFSSVLDGQLVKTTRTRYMLI